ncbi:MvaI/BcnI family restriction endonuclease [Cypionkella sinensis]|uniref:MvaI/BcnI family restriction endonuclease n=1 Tax=Cypionkella sinensis TaxID=1756043 RepID=A0ABV7IU53_9RHOB
MKKPPSGKPGAVQCLDCGRVEAQRGSQCCGAGWIASKRLDKTGIARAYAARNGGGYTLEAELGIIPNGIAEPDFHGWEVKQYAVTNFLKMTPVNAVTLLTPEPTGGVYSADIYDFLERYGYPDQSGKPNRRNFGGIYKVGEAAHHLTTLRLEMTGYNAAKGIVTDDNGTLRLLDPADIVAAEWVFPRLLTHWLTKHAQACYVPALANKDAVEYQYSDNLHLFTGTDFLKLLKAMHDGTVYMDPSFNGITTAGNVRIERRRNQFRVNHKHLPLLYDKHEIVVA